MIDEVRALAPWSTDEDLSDEQWDRYTDVARRLQKEDPTAVEQLLASVLDAGTGPDQTDDETRLFLLMRVLFDLPEQAPVDQRRVFKGWINWPEPDANGNVNLSWPVSWKGGRPRLVGFYEGSEGHRYAAVEEYRHLREHASPRKL